ALHGLLEAADVAFADSLEEDGVRADLASADLGGVHPCGDLLAEGGGVGAEGAPGFGVAADVPGHRVDGDGVRAGFGGSVGEGGGSVAREVSRKSTRLNSSQLKIAYASFC